MHVVVGGYGRVGKELAHLLESEGHSVAVIDHDARVFVEDVDPIAGEKIVAPVFARDAMIRAGIERADVFAAVTSGDNSNIVAARNAREVFHVPRVVARIFGPRRAEIYRNFGIPTIASVTWTSARLYDVIAHPEAHSVFQYGNSEVEMVEVGIPAAVAGRKLSDVENAGEIRVASIVRGGAAFVPDSGFVFEEGDIAFINVRRESVPSLERTLGMKE